MDGNETSGKHGLKLEPMLLNHAVASNYAAIAALANLAYRGTGPSASWNAETGIIDGERLNESLLREDLAAKPNSHLLIYREDADGPLLGTVWLEPKQEGVWYLGLLMVRPDLQNRHLGRNLLSAAENFARERGATKIRMTVVHLRDPLIAWYQRRGYSPTGETEAFPSEDERIGRPLRDDLHFVVLAKDI